MHICYLYVCVCVCVCVCKWKDGGREEGLHENNGIAVVDVALCLTLLLARVTLVVQLCICMNTPLFFICDEEKKKKILPHLRRFKMLRI